MTTVYPSDFEEKIGFAPLRALLKEKCLSRRGAEEVDRMAFATDWGFVVRRLRLVDELCGLLEASAELPVENLHDVGPYLAEIRAAGSFMSADRLWKLRMFLETVGRLSRFVASYEAEHPGSALGSEFGAVASFPQCVALIDSSINRFGEVKDSASPALSELRTAMARTSAAMAGIMRRFISKAAAEGIVEPDATPAVRNGRPVVPVASMLKRKVNGIVHDESATGKTIYIEPAEVVEAGNRLRELEIEERREVVRILISIADSLRPEIEGIEASVERMGMFDFARAKALLAIETDARMPHIEKKREFELYHAVHPVLLLSLRRQHRDVVPLSLTLTPQQRILIISGPNAGGKSVCLKTIGCVQYMMQCGLLPTVYENSHLSIFSTLLADIGDEQSIENDLSTYSSHLRNMKFFLRHAGPDTLLLADEMGSGTEPQIGGALAQAILAQLGRDGCFGVVTTHYQNLKTFASDTEGFVNGAMLYDRQRLAPTFQLEVGNPGSSFAVEIARNIGLPADVIDEARRIVGSDYVNLDKYLLDVARDRRYWANKRMRIREQEQKLDRTLANYEERADALRKERAEILRAARAEASELLAGANAKLENAIRQIREVEADKARTKEIRAELEAYKKDVATADNALEPKQLRPLKGRKKGNAPTREAAPSAPASKRTKEVAAGDYVRMSDGGVVGRVLSVSGKEAEVAFGALRTRVSVKKLIPASAPKPSSAAAQNASVGAATYAASRQRQLNFHTELDIRGMRADEALQAVMYFIDDAVQFSAHRLRILHGTGTGALRQAVREYLAHNSNVAHFADEDVRFGGAGITVVDLA